MDSETRRPGHSEKAPFSPGELVVYANISAAKLKQVNLLLRGEVTWEPNTTKNLQLGDQRVSPLQLS